MELKILVTGSRTWTNEDKIKQAFLALATDYPLEIIHGGAKGADTMANDVARSLGIRSTTFNADWERYGRLAGPKRNLEMLDREPDLVLAFQVGKSRGTQHTIDNARKRGIPVKVYHD